MIAFVQRGVHIDLIDRIGWILVYARGHEAKAHPDKKETTAVCK